MTPSSLNDIASSGNTLLNAWQVFLQGTEDVLENIRPGGCQKPFHGETGLNLAATYYWKVMADDGHAGLAQVMAEDSLLKLMSDKKSAGLV